MTPFASLMRAQPSLHTDLLPTLVRDGSTPSSVYSAVAAKYNVRESSMPAFRAHLSRRLVRLAEDNGFGTNRVPELARALVEYLENDRRVGRLGRELARTISIPYATFERSLGAIANGLNAAQTAPNRTSVPQLLPPTKDAITRALVLAHAASPLTPGDARLEAIGDAHGASKHQVAALKAWITMRVECQLANLGVHTNQRAIGSGLVGLAGMLGEGVRPTAPAFRKECERLVSLSARAKGRPDLDAEMPSQLAQEMAVVLFKNWAHVKLAGYGRAEIAEDWGLLSC